LARPPARSVIVAHMIRFFLLRFLPRRLVPVLLVVEAFRFIRGWRARNKPPIAPPAGRRPARTVEIRDEGTPTTTWTDRTT
jgi:hypothetical protein